MTYPQVPHGSSRDWRRQDVANDEPPMGWAVACTARFLDRPNTIRTLALPTDAGSDHGAMSDQVPTEKAQWWRAIGTVRARSPACGTPNRVRRQQVQSRCRRIASRAKMRAVADLRVNGVGAMNAWDYKVSRHRYARLRASRTGGATDPLSARMPQDMGPLDSRIPDRSCPTGATYMCPGREVGITPI